MEEKKKKDRLKIAGGMNHSIDFENFKKIQRQQKIYNKGKGTDNPHEKETFMKRTGPRLPLAQKKKKKNYG